MVLELDVPFNTNTPAPPPLADRLAAGDPTLFRGAPVGPSVLDIPSQSWAETVLDATKDQFFWQGWNALGLGAGLYEIDPEFKPLSPDNIKGWEQYASTLRLARNAPHMEAMKNQIRENENRRMRLAANAGWTATIVSEVFNPFNYIGGLGIKAGAGFLTNALRAGAVNAPFIAGEELGRQYIDPTAQVGESVGNVFYGTVFAGLIGGGIGKIAGGLAKARAQRIGRAFEEESIVRDAIIEGRDPVEAVRNARSSAVSRETGPTIQVTRPDGTTVNLRDTARVFDEAALPFEIAGRAYESVRQVEADILRIEAEQAQRLEYLNNQSKLEARAKDVGEPPAVYRQLIEENYRNNETALAELKEARKSPELTQRFEVEKQNASNIQFRELDDLEAPFSVERALDEQIDTLKDVEILRGEYRAERTTFDPGLKKVGGLERLAKIPGFHFIQLVQSGYRGAADFALQLAGEMDVVLARNAAKIGLGTPESASLRAGYWRAKAADYDLDVQAIYNDYLTGGGGEGRTAFGINIGVAGARATQAARRLRDQLPTPVSTRLGATAVTNGKMDYSQFVNEIGVAFRSDRIEPGPTVPDDAKIYVERAAQLAHKMFDEARVEGYKYGLLPSKAGAKARFARTQELMRQAQDELNAEGLNPLVEDLLYERMQRLHNEADTLNATWLAEDARLMEIAERIADEADIKRRRASSKRERLIASLDESIERDLHLFDELENRYRTAGLTGAQERLHKILEERLSNLFRRRINGQPEAIPRIGEDRTLTSRNDGRPLMAVYREGQIFINPDAIEQGFADKVWNNPKVEGVQPLSDDLFPTIDEWRDFVIRHEVAHETRKRRDGESLGAYESRINYEALRSGGRLTLADYLNYATDRQRAYHDLLKSQMEQPLSMRQREFFEAIKHRLNASLEDPDIGIRPTDPFYMPRRWNVQAIMEDEAGPQRFRAALREWYKETATRKGLKDSEELIEKRVDKTIENLIGEPTPFTEISHWSGRFSWQRRRRLDIPNDRVQDFIELNMPKLMRDYMDNFGISLEVTRMFGTRDASDGIEDALLQAAREGANAKRLDKLRSDMVDLREMTLGDMYRRDPLTLEGYTADMLKAFSVVTMLGRIIKTVVVEPARLVIANGLMRNFGDGFDLLTRNLATFKNVSKELRALTGEGWDTSLGLASRRFMVEGGYMGRSTSPTLNKIYDRSLPFLDFSRGPYYIMNLLSPATDAMKNYQNVLGAHFMIEDIHRAAAGKASDKTISRLLSLGFQKSDFEKIASLSQKSGRIHVPATGTWGDAGLVRRFAGAVAGETRRVIATAGAANRSRYMTGHMFGEPGERRRFALASLPFQFLQFPIAGIQKYMLAMAQGRDASPFLGVALMVGLGYVSTWLKVGESAWDDMPMEERILRSIEQSGVLAIYGDLPSMLEQMSGNRLGIRPLLGLEAKFPWNDELDQFSTLGGPAADKIVDMYRLFLSGDTKNRERARILRRMIPLADLIYWHNQVRKIDPYLEDALDGLGIK